MAAIALKRKLETQISALPIQLPMDRIPQAKAMFRTVLFMTQRGIAHRGALGG